MLFFYILAEEQELLYAEIEDAAQPIEPPNKKKARQCKTCHKPMKGHPRSHCLA